MARRGRMAIAAATVALTATGCAGDGQLTADQVTQLYLEHQEEQYGRDLADTTVQDVGAIVVDGPCTAAEVVEEQGADVTAFIRDGAIVDVVTGHLTDWLDVDEERCWSS